MSKKFLRSSFLGILVLLCLGCANVEAPTTRANIATKVPTNTPQPTNTATPTQTLPKTPTQTISPSQTGASTKAHEALKAKITWVMKEAPII